MKLRKATEDEILDAQSEVAEFMLLVGDSYSSMRTQVQCAIFEHVLFTKGLTTRPTLIQKTAKAEVGDYIQDGYEYCRIIDITENDGDNLYHLDSGSILSDGDFNEEDVRLESEIFG